MPAGKVRPLLPLVALVALPVLSPAADWPMWRHDASRSAASPHTLPARLHLQWVRQLPTLTPAWPDQPKLQVDAVYEPVVLGKRMFIGSSVFDTATAYDTESGKELWRHHADGPVRYPPAAWENKVYFTCDDGYLYCVDAVKGTLLWKFRGGASDHKVLGKGRLISTWPARGGPVVADGTVYFAAGIWPFMGIFLHALDARTGKVVWTNDGDGSLYIKQPHNADSFAGVAPQGALVVAGDKLLVPGGRSVPACFDRRTGKLLHYRLGENGKRGGGAEVAALGRFYVNGGAAYLVATGDYLGPVGEQVVVAGDAVYSATPRECQLLDWRSGLGSMKAPDSDSRLVQRALWSPPVRASFALPGLTALIKAGPRLYVASPGRVAAVEPAPSGATVPVVSWQAAVEGKPVRLLAANRRLFAVTLEGRIYCFGKERVEPRLHRWAPTSAPARDDSWAETARAVLDETNARDGYCVAWGVGTGRLIRELVRQSRLHVIAIDPDAERVSAFRRDLRAAGLYGERVAVHVGDPLTFELPPYLASLMVSEDLGSAGVEPGPVFLRRAFQALRPYGGVACLPVPAEQREEMTHAIAELGLANAEVRAAPEGLLLSREGALPGAGDWTHEHADAANTRVSRDRVVKAPLGLLWFGGPSHDGVLPRHGHGPQPQVLGGRLFIEGTDMLRAVDIYTGRLLWQAPLPGVGKAYDNLSHQPGANATGSNYVSAADGIYVAYGKSCVRLDPATGRKLSEFPFPRPPGVHAPLTWDYVNVHEDYLVGGSDPVTEDDPSCSRHLAVMDRYTGRVLWTATARSGFRHNAVCLGGGRLYAIDRVSVDQLARLKNRGPEPKEKARLVAWDLATGEEVWSTEADVFGTWLSYSGRHDVLVEAGRVARDTLSDEPKGMRAHRGADGKVLWHEKTYLGPAMIHGNIVLKD